jgi:hypothetical protein
MTKILSLLIFSVIAFSCKLPREKHVNHEKWKTLDNNAGRLKGRPKEVNEYHCTDLTDTLFSSLISGKYCDHYTYQFDKEGNLIFIKTFTEGLFTTVQNVKYDEDGIQSELISYLLGGTNRSKRVSHKSGSGKYEVDRYEGEKKIYTGRITILGNGKRIITQKIADGIIASTDTQYYRNDNLIRSISIPKAIGGDEVRENIYYYSDKGFLDSAILSRTGEKQIKHYYLNNSHGNPVYDEEVEGDEIVLQRWMKYEYDKTGNWVKRIDNTKEIKRFNSPSNTFNVEKYPGYSLNIREIKY